mgnify:CR=1 FL=1
MRYLAEPNLILESLIYLGLRASKLDPELLRYIAHPTKEAVLLCLRHKEDSSIVEPLISDMSGQEVVETLEELGISLLPDYA